MHEEQTEKIWQSRAEQSEKAKAEQSGQTHVGYEMKKRGTMIPRFLGF